MTIEQEFNNAIKDIDFNLLDLEIQKAIEELNQYEKVVEDFFNVATKI